MFRLLLQTIISNQMRLRRLRGDVGGKKLRKLLLVEASDRDRDVKVDKIKNADKQSTVSEVHVCPRTLSCFDACELLQSIRAHSHATNFTGTDEPTNKEIIHKTYNKSNVTSSKNHKQVLQDYKTNYKVLTK